MALEAGARLGAYEVTSRIGAGGMGEVYRARDLKLGREAALKVLPEELAADPERLRRFEQEARAASALNHPSIVTIYDIDEHESIHYIAMELVEGTTLAQLIRRRNLPLGRAVACAIQMADGLARAHEKGIVHRDLKPDNVMVTEDGQVKILDFGLAKLVEPGIDREAPTLELHQPQTREHHLLGTVPYMSPEQSEGKTLDARSDIFSFGSVLHEMVTGRRAFQAGSTAGLLAAVLHDDPGRVSDVVPSVPRDLDTLIARALRKAPESRPQSMAEVMVALQDIKEEMDSGSAVSAEQVLRVQKRSRRRTGPWLAAAAALALGVGLAGWLVWGRASPASAPLRTIPLTSDPGVEMGPVLSPDGSYVAHVRVADDGSANLCIMLVDGGTPLVVARGVLWYSYAWSPSSREIAFGRSTTEDDGTSTRRFFVASALGGAERPVANSRAQWWFGLDWSPDGKLLAFPDRQPGDPSDGIFIFSLDTGEKRRLTVPPGSFVGDADPRFSPDGRSVAFFRWRARFQSDLYVVPVRGGEPRAVTAEGGIHSGPAWAADGQSLVYSATRGGRAGQWSLWRVPILGGEPVALAVGERGSYPTVSRQGGRLAYTRPDMKANIWRAPGPAGRQEDGTPAPIISSTRWNNYPSYSPDGKQILFGSYRSGDNALWISESDGSNPRQLTFLGEKGALAGSWSPDGERVAFHATDEGQADIHVVSASGGMPQRLTTDPSEERDASWSRDGLFLYFASNRTGRYEIYRMPAAGGEAVQVTTNGGTEARESQDGRFLYFTKDESGIFGPGAGPLSGIWRIPLEGGEETRVHDRGWIHGWALLERGLCYLNLSSRPSPSSIELFDFATGDVRPVAALPEGATRMGLSVSPDERWILYQAGETESDIMLVENFR